MAWTHTSRGKALDLLDPQLEDVDLDEIGLALSNLCRYAGCVLAFVSVAEHSWLVSTWLREQGHPPLVQLAGLLHDGAEAYMGDMTWPVQAALFSDDWDRAHPGAGAAVKARYRFVQRRLDELICQHAACGLEPAMFHTDPVKDADLRILLDERAVLLAPGSRPWFLDEIGAVPLGVEIQAWRPEVARIEWLARLRQLLAVCRG